MAKKEILHGDCLELMKDIPDGSIDMILCDLPYGTTACKWDTIIPFEPLWEQYERIIKPNGAIVLTASQPFTTDLINSNRKLFKYLWYWIKNLPSGFALSKKQPMRCVEDIAVFYKQQPIYNKQPTKTIISDRKVLEGRKNGSGSANNKSKHFPNMNKVDNIIKENVCPKNYLEIKCVSNSGGHKLHNTQKPVALFEYLIKTYTNEGDLVLDNCAGSGTTAIACLNTNRQFIVMEKEQKYYDIILKRVADFNSAPPLFIQAK
jgi:site-specific DNA-methyltransferase (adenine-specific)